jgi:hypothetical protein
MIISLQFTHKMLWQTLLEVRGVPRGYIHPVHPPPHPAMCIPSSPAWKAGYEKSWGSGQQENMQVCLPKHNYKFDNNL